MPTDELSDLARRGLAIYDEQLRPLLEPKHNNQYVAIHVPTADFAVARSSGDAMRDVLRRHAPDGQLVVRKVGPEPDYGLAARVLAGEMLAHKAAR